MQNYKTPIEDYRFLLKTFDYEGQVQTLPELEDFDIDLSLTMLEEFAKFCEAVLMPLNEVGDREGLKFDGATGAVTTPTGFKDAYQQFCDNGLMSLSHPVEYEGAGAPFTLAVAASEVLIATNKSLSMVVGLSNGFIDALHAHGSDELKDKYLPKLVSGEWSGTMCLTEPQCGTDLGLLTTKAEDFGDHYKLTGTKIWITFGEHDLAENIIHLVLARLPGAPEGIKGISVFVVPKFLDDGSPNGVTCGGLDHKMGIKASPTCVINLENSEGWLVGLPHKGMRPMFTMMNAARLNVGQEGVALAEAAYQAALSFAKDRRQSRSLNPARQDPNHAADNILVHPDVRRMLLNIKSTNEAMRGLAMWIAMNYDVMHKHPDEAARQKANDLVALLTPIIKSYGSERGFWNVSEAMQVTGGAGYTTDWPIEQYLRDVRIAMIYEGTNHIQALDLVGRKLPKAGGRLLKTFMGEVTALIRECADDERMEEFITPLKAESKRLSTLTMGMAGKMMQDREEAGAAASNYLNLFALVTLAYVWARQVKTALEVGGDQGEAKVQTARYFYAMVLPEADTFARLALVGKAPMMDFDIKHL